MSACDNSGSIIFLEFFYAFHTVLLFPISRKKPVTAVITDFSIGAFEQVQAAVFPFQRDAPRQ